MKFILGKKLAMTQVFKDDGTVIPVTKVSVGPCQVTQVKQADNMAIVQIGFGVCRDKVLSKAQKGHLKDLTPVKKLRDFVVSIDQASQIKRGDNISLDTFAIGDKVTITGISKGKGFQGVVKRHGFHGSPASHGHKDQLRMPGSIGATGPQKVFKGTKMGGRMGGDQITVKNLEIVKIDLDNNEFYIKGAVPGARNGLLKIKGEGDLKISEIKKAENKTESNKQANTEDVKIETEVTTVEEVKDNKDNKDERKIVEIKNKGEKKEELTKEEK